MPRAAAMASVGAIDEKGKTPLMLAAQAAAHGAAMAAMAALSIFALGAAVEVRGGSDPW